MQVATESVGNKQHPNGATDSSPMLQQTAAQWCNRQQLNDAGSPGREPFAGFGRS